jgi:Ser/Thr protein kinase RdoA (MazF antagonist)
VALSKYVGEGEPLTLIERFVSGYMQTGKLSDAEIECMPDMVSEIWCFPWHDG